MTVGRTKIKHYTGAFALLLMGISPLYAGVKMIPMAPLLTESAETYLTQVQGLPENSFAIAPMSASMTVPQCGEDIKIQPRGGQLTTLTMTCTKPIYWKRHVSIRLMGNTETANTATAPVQTHNKLPTLNNKANRVQQQTTMSKSKQNTEKNWQAVVLTGPLEKGHIIQPEDVTTKTVTRNPGGNTYTDVTQVLNLEVRYNLQHNHVLRYSDVKKQAMVRRGDNVVLISKGTGFSISMEGVAENDASVGQRIRATNRSSGKTVYGVLQKDKSVLVKEFK